MALAIKMSQQAPANDADGDNDGVSDGLEIENGMNPTNGSDAKDSDNDGVTDGEEVIRGTNPASVDMMGMASVMRLKFKTVPIRKMR